MKLYACLCLALGMLACGPQVPSDPTEGTAGSGSADPTIDATGSAATDSEGTTPDVGEENPCPPGQGFCDGACVDLLTNNDHCGRCGNVCENLYTAGMCEEGTCPPNYECGGARTDYRDCNEVCESLGTSCQDGLGCGGDYDLYYDLRGVENCEARLGGGWSPGPDEVGCSAPINWSQNGGLTLEPPVAVSCCCLQI